ncbi:533_t:CDS:2, partial [Racocetra fulgida]
PILSDGEIDEELTITDSNYQVSDNENENNVEKDATARSITEEVQSWENLINEWIKFGNRKNQFEDRDDEILMTSDWDTEFEAKWSLDSLFISSLETPLYFGSEFTSNE